MNLNRKFLRTAALGAILALAFAGTALAAIKTWTGGGTDPHKWDADDNWTPNKPGDTDTAIISTDATITTLDADASVAILGFVEGGKLTVNIAANKLTVKGIQVAEAPEATLRVAGNPGNFVWGDAGSSPVKILEGSKLILQAAAPHKVTGVAGPLTLSGAGTLTLKAPVATVNALKIENGGTLVVDVDDALPALAATGLNNIAKGNLVVNAEDFGSAATVLTLKDGNLTLNNPMKEALKTVRIQSGDLVVAEGVEIGNPLTPTGEVELGKAADKVGPAGDRKSVV